MSWFKVDDRFHSHPKVIAVDNASIGLWTKAGSWCADALTDGRLPTKIVQQFGTVRQANQLVDAGLWEKTDEGYRFHDWDSMNPSRDQVESDRAALKKRMRKFRTRHGNGVGNGSRNAVTPEGSYTCNGVTNGVSNTTPTRITPKGVIGEGTGPALGGRPLPTPHDAQPTPAEGEDDSAEVIHLGAGRPRQTDDPDSYQRRAELARRNDWPECWI